VASLPPDLAKIHLASCTTAAGHEDEQPNSPKATTSDSVRLCHSCLFELFHAEGIFQEVWDNKEKLSFAFWRDVVFHKKVKTSELFDIPFPINMDEIGLMSSDVEAKEAQVSCYETQLCVSY